MDRPCRDPNTPSGDPLFLFLSPTKGVSLQHKRSKQPFHVIVEFKNGMTRNVTVRAMNREIAERRALKFHPSAVGVKRNVA